MLVLHKREKQRITNENKMRGGKERCSKKTFDNEKVLPCSRLDAFVFETLAINFKRGRRKTSLKREDGTRKSWKLI